MNQKLSKRNKIILAIVTLTSNYGNIRVIYDQNKRTISMDDVILENGGTSAQDYIKFKIEYTGNVDQDIWIYWKDVTNTFCDYANLETGKCTGLPSNEDVRDEINYTTYECNSGNYLAATNENLTGCEAVSTLKTRMPQSGETSYLTTDNKITLNEETKYYIVVGEITNENHEQNYNQNKTYSGKVWVDKEDPNSVYNTKLALYPNENTLGYKILTNSNTTKYTKTADFTKAAVSKDQYDNAPTSLSDYQERVCDSDSDYYDSWFCSVCTPATANYNIYGCTLYYEKNSNNKTTYNENGLFSALDDDGTTIYYRGVNENNYVKFAGFIWRIMRINGDGSIRIILDGITSKVKQEGSTVLAGSNVRYNNENYNPGPTNNTNLPTALEYASYDGGELEEAINLFYTTYLSSYSSHFADAIFCSDTGLGGTYSDGTNWFFSAYTRIEVNKQPSFICNADYKYTISNSKLSHPIATTSADEVTYAGALNDTTNMNYYLNNVTTINYYWWTMTPRLWNSSLGLHAYPVRTKGGLGNTLVNTNIGVRPVINLVSTTTVTGEGTSTSPWVVQ